LIYFSSMLKSWWICFVLYLICMIVM
jgi:hypothetical protein